MVIHVFDSSFMQLCSEKIQCLSSNFTLIFFYFFSTECGGKHTQAHTLTHPHTTPQQHNTETNKQGVSWILSISYLDSLCFRFRMVFWPTSQARLGPVLPGSPRPGCSLCTESPVLRIWVVNSASFSFPARYHHLSLSFYLYFFSCFPFFFLPKHLITFPHISFIIYYAHVFLFSAFPTRKSTPRDQGSVPTCLTGVF